MADAPAPDTALERTIARDRALVAAALVLAALLCGAWIVPMARDMNGTMDGPSAWMMTDVWDASHVLLLFAMWSVMMIGMMLPSAAPTLLLYAHVVRSSDARASAGGRAYLFAAGYAVTWTAFAAMATLLQRVLTSFFVLSPMMALQERRVSAAVLVVAGAYQFTPLKHACLGVCRSPAVFIATHWRRGRAGAFRMGWEHGLVCLGCCWALMLLLFVGGVMNLTTIFWITALVLAEKIAPLGAIGGRISGVGLVLAGLWMLRG